MHDESPPMDEEGALGRGVQQAGASLHGSIERLADPVYGALYRASARAHEGVDRLTDSAQATAGKVDMQVRRVADTVRDIPHQAAEQARDVVRLQPLRAVAIAFALGWLFGRLG